MTGIKYTDLKIVRDETKAVVTVKSATVDKNDNTKVAIETYEALTDGKSYTVTYTAADEAKTESSATFTATAGVVADIALNTYTVPANTPTVIKYQLLDANGVLIEEKGIGDTSKSDKVEISMENFTGYQKNNEITLYTVGDKAKLKVVYHTWKYNNTDGTEDGKVEKPFEITAVDPSSVIETYDYSVVMKAGDAVDFKRDTLVHQIAIDDDKTNNNTPGVKLSFRKADGTDITANLDYTVTSGNENVLLANGYVSNRYVQLTPVATGATYLMIKNAAGNVIQTLPINVVAKRELSTMTVDRSSVTVSQTTNTAGEQRITVAAMDQYAVGYTNYSVDQPVLKSNNDPGTNTLDVKSARTINNKTVITVKATGAKEGTYFYTMDLIDNGKTTNNIKKVSFTVTVSKQVGNTSFALVMMNAGKNSVVSKVDTTVTADPYGDIKLYPTIVKKINGSIAGQASAAEVATVAAVTLSKSGTKVSNNGIYDEIPDGAGVTVNTIGVNVALGTGAANDIIVKKLDAGTYTLNLKASVKQNDGSWATQNMSTSFVVEDTQHVFEAKVNEESMPKTITSFKDTFENTDYVTFYYASQSLEKAEYIYADVDKTNFNNNQVNVKKVFMNVTVPGTNGKVVRLAAPVNRTFTFAGTVDNKLDVAKAKISDFNKAFNAETGYLNANGTLKSGLAPASKAALVASADAIVVAYNALTAGEKTSIKNAVDFISGLITEAEAAVVSDITTPATLASMDTDDLAETFSLLDISEDDYDSDELANYLTLMSGVSASEWAAGTATIRTTSADPEPSVSSVKNVLLQIIQAVKDTKAEVVASAGAINTALTTDVEAQTVVTHSSIDANKKATIDFSSIEGVVSVAVNGTITTPENINVDEVSASAIGKTVNVMVAVTDGDEAISGSGIKVPVTVSYKVSKALTIGTKTVTYAAVSVDKASAVDEVEAITADVVITNQKNTETTEWKWIVSKK